MTKEDLNYEHVMGESLEPGGTKDEILERGEENDGDIASSQDEFIVIKTNETMNTVLTALESAWDDIENEGLTGYFGSRQEFYNQMLGSFYKEKV